MPVGYLSESQAREYGCFPDELTPDQLARYFHLDDADRAFVALHRGDHNRLGVAVQLWLGDDEFPPNLRFLWDENADQYIRYETMYFAKALLLSRIAGQMKEP